MRCATMNRMIRLPIALWLVLSVGLFVGTRAWSEPYKPDSGPYQVDSFLLELHDEARDRAVPIKIYYPYIRGGQWPVVLVSHGLGGSRQGLSYLGNHWASHGYVCIHMQHPGSDESVWRGVPAREVLKAMRKAANNPKNAIDRANDVPFVLDELEKMNSDKKSKLYAMVNLNNTAIAGHSFGAWSAMAAGGMTVGGTPGKRGLSFADTRIRCMIPLSPPVVSRERLYETTYSSLNIPALFMTGTLDTSPINNTQAHDRLIPYRYMPGPSDQGQPKYLINFNGADHMTFAGETKQRLRSKVSLEDNKAFHSLILQSTTAFLDCYLLDDKHAKQWLNNGAFVQTVGDYGEVEMQTDQ